MEKIIITKEQLNDFDGEVDWAVSDVLLNHLDEKELNDYEDAVIIGNEVRVLDSNEDIIAVFQYEVEEETTMKNIMTRAWEIAREGKEKFGGKVSEYLSESMKIAWEQYKLYAEYETEEKERKNIATIDQDLKIDELLKYFAPLSHNNDFDVEGFKAIVINWANKKGNITKQEASKMISDLVKFKNDYHAA